MRIKKIGLLAVLCMITLCSCTKEEKEEETREEINESSTKYDTLIEVSDNDSETEAASYQYIFIADDQPYSINDYIYDASVEDVLDITVNIKFFSTFFLTNYTIDAAERTLDINIQNKNFVFTDNDTLYHFEYVPLYSTTAPVIKDDEWYLPLGTILMRLGYEIETAPIENNVVRITI